MEISNAELKTIGSNASTVIGVLGSVIAATVRNVFLLNESHRSDFANSAGADFHAGVAQRTVHRIRNQRGCRCRQIQNFSGRKRLVVNDEIVHLNGQLFTDCHGNDAGNAAFFVGAVHPFYAVAINAHCASVGVFDVRPVNPFALRVIVSGVVRFLNTVVPAVAGVEIRIAVAVGKVAKHITIIGTAAIKRCVVAEPESVACAASGSRVAFNIRPETDRTGFIQRRQEVDKLIAGKRPIVACGEINPLTVLAGNGSWRTCNSRRELRIDVIPRIEIEVGNNVRTGETD